MYKHARLYKISCVILPALLAVGCDSAELKSPAIQSDLAKAVKSQSFSNHAGYCEPIQLDISGTRLMGFTDDVNSSLEITLTSPIPRGDYIIRLHYEDETHPDQPDQFNEVWHAEFFDDSGNTVQMTSDTADLPTDEVVSYTDVGEYNFALDVHSVKTVHGYQAGEYNSIDPTMIELYPHCNHI